MAANRLLVLCALVVFALPVVAAAGNAGLTGSLEAFRVVKGTQGEEDFVPADKASPRDIIEYRFTYRNTGDDPVRNVFLTDPIPSGTEYIIESATRPAAGRVEFSVDGGKTYRAWPIVIHRKYADGSEDNTRATPDMVTHIRWIIEDTCQPDSQVTVSYRTLVK